MNIFGWGKQDWVTTDEFRDSQRKTRALISALNERLGKSVGALQDQLDSLTAAVTTGIDELKTEIARLAAIPAGETVDFTALTALADGLLNDNIPAAPPVEEVPVEPTA